MGDGKTSSQWCGYGPRDRRPATSVRSARRPRSDGRAPPDHRASLRDPAVLLPQGAGVLRAENNPSPRLGTVARPLPDPQVSRRATPPRERQALPRALQPTRLRLADEDQGDAREGDGARGDRRVAEPQGSTDAAWWTPMVGGHRAESVRLIARGSSPRSRQTVLLSGLPEPEAIRYRQAVLTDCLEHSAIVRQLYDLAVEALESKKRAQVFLFRDSPDALLQKSVRILELLADVLRRLRGLADEHAAAGYVARRAWLLHPQLAQQRAPLRVVLVVPYALGDEAHVRPVERGDDGSAGEDRVLDALPEPDGLRRVVHRGR